MRLLFFVLCAASNPTFSQNIENTLITPGEGAEYQLQLRMGEAKVALYFVPAPNKKLKAIEMYFETPGMGRPIQLWQQFHLAKPGNKIHVKNAFIFSYNFGVRRLDKEYLKGFDGVQLNQFLVSSQEELKKHFISQERIQVPAGVVNAHRYRVESAGQTVDFWIHHDSKPIGLVKMISKGGKASQNYSMKLTRLLSGVAQKIISKEALPMDDKTRSFLPKPGTAKGLGLF